MWPCSAPARSSSAPRTPTAAARRSAAAPCNWQRRRARIEQRRRGGLQRGHTRPARLQPGRGCALRRGDHQQPFRIRHVYADRRQRQRQRHVLGSYPEHERRDRTGEDRHGHAGPWRFGHLQRRHDPLRRAAQHQRRCRPGQRGIDRFRRHARQHQRHGAHAFHQQRAELERQLRLRRRQRPQSRQRRGHHERQPHA